MSNSERKARKRAGEKIQREPKVGTPLEHRRITTVFDPTSGKIHPSRRQYNRIAEVIRIRDGVKDDGGVKASD